MYSGWVSERDAIEDACGCSSVLHSYPTTVGKEVTSSIIRSLVLLPNEKREFFKSCKDLDWTMDVVCYGLTMSLDEVEMIKNCVFLYLEWMTVIMNKPKPGIPVQICENKDQYFCVMLKHIANLFIPRESSATVIQATLCTKVLKHIRAIVEEGGLQPSVLESVLRFYLGISGHLLSVPPAHGGLAEQLCGKLINCLLNVWLEVCCVHFPPPSLWCTLNEMLLTWRHHDILILQWNRLMYRLTCHVLTILYGPDYPLPSLYNEEDPTSDPITIPKEMTNEIIVQCWHRFMHVIGNPVTLCKLDEVTATKYFRLYYAEVGKPPEMHSSLKSLSTSFYNAMNGISVLISMFLGTARNAERRCFSIASQSFQRGDWKSSSTGTIQINHEVKTGSFLRKFSEQNQIVRDDSALMDKPSKQTISVETNSILHIFSTWLFETCLTGINLEKVLTTIGRISFALPITCLELTKEEKEQNNFPVARKNEFEPGRAQTFSTLCHIFCRQEASRQAILPVYLSRFYLSLAIGLCYAETRAGQVLGSILLSGTDLFRLDLQGVQVVVPHVLQALEIILPAGDELSLGYEFSVVELRHSCIQILLSMLCMPLHFMDLPIQGLCREKLVESSFQPNITFMSLRSRFTHLLYKSLKVETNPLNTQMLLGGARLLMEDTVQVEVHNYDAKTYKPGSLPCIVLEESSAETSVVASPKLIHIAASPSSTGKKSAKRKSVFNKKNIGKLGENNNILTTKGQFVYICNLLCQKLMFGNWKGHLQVTLAALEFLSEMAQLDIKFIDENKAKHTLKWVCNYIEFQARQPPPAHSKDLHSIIVAAFSCIQTWVVHQPWLLDDERCLSTVTEVIELGISGSKSKASSPEENSALKGEKELRPVSFRVREAAEALLALIMEHVGFFPTPCGASSMYTLLDEKDFDEPSSTHTKFTYYALNGSVILGLLEDNAKGAEKDNVPSMKAIIRAPTGKKVCLMQFRHFSRVKQHLALQYQEQAETPSGLQNIPPAPPTSQRCYPHTVANVECTQADFSIPDIKALLKDEMEKEQEATKKIISKQSEKERLAQQKLLENTSTFTLKQPESKEECSVGRMFLSQMGILSLQNLQATTSHEQHGLQRLTDGKKMLDTELQRLDTFPCRTFDTLYVVYVKKGQTDALSILQNKIPSLESQLFTQLLQSMGWLVNQATHTGWNGDQATSWRTDRVLPDKKMYYYADPLTELAIHVPAINIGLPRTPITPRDETDNMSFTRIPVFEQVPTADDTTPPAGGASKFTHEQTGSVEVKHKNHNCHSETKVVVAWLQDFGDASTFPVLDLLELHDPCGYTTTTTSEGSKVPEKEVLIIYLLPLKTGLFRIKVATVFGSRVGGPLFDGMVVSRRVLGSLVRNTAINFCRRRRLEIDSFSPPHVCRKLKLQEIVREHSEESTVPKFYTSLF